MAASLVRRIGGINPWVLGAGFAGLSLVSSSGVQNTVSSLGTVIQLAPYLLVGGMGLYAVQLLK